MTFVGDMPTGYPYVDATSVPSSSIPSLLQQLGWGGTPSIPAASTGLPSLQSAGSVGVGGMINGFKPPTLGPSMPFPQTSMGATGLQGMGRLGMAPALAAQVAPKGFSLPGFSPAAVTGAASKFPRTLGSKALGIFSKPTFTKGGGLVALGAGVAGNLLGNVAGGNDTFMGRLLQGGGIGAGIGALGGPWGALAGGVGGGLYNAFFGGDDTPDFEEKLDKVLDQGDFTPEDSTQIKLMYDILKETIGEDEAKTKIGDIIVQDMVMREQAGVAAQDSQAKMLATQALTAQFFQPFTQQLLDSAQQRYAITEKVADDLPPAYQSVARAQNAASLDNANRVATAYASQAQLMPMFAAMEQQQSMAQQLAQQQAAQGMAQLYGGGGGGGGSLADILAAQAGG